MPTTRQSMEIAQIGGKFMHASRTVTPNQPEEQVILDEEMVGVGTQKVGFPDLKLCQGVVCVMNDGTMVGGHFSSAASEVNMTQLMINQIERHGGPGAIQKMVVAYDPAKKPDVMWDASTKAGMLGFQGEVDFVNTGVLKEDPGEGAYLQVERAPDGNVTISGVRNESMDYTSGVLQHGRIGKTACAPKAGVELAAPPVQAVPGAAPRVGAHVHAGGGGASGGHGRRV